VIDLRLHDLQQRLAKAERVVELAKLWRGADKAADAFEERGEEGEARAEVRAAINVLEQLRELLDKEHGT
jgi:hypothetical protein